MTAQPTANEPPSQAWAELVEAADRLDAMLHEFRDEVLVRAVAAGLAEDESFKESVDQMADDVRAGRGPAESSLEERRQRWGS